MHVHVHVHVGVTFRAAHTCMVSCEHAIPWFYLCGSDRPHKLFFNVVSFCHISHARWHGSVAVWYLLPSDPVSLNCGHTTCVVVVVKIVHLLYPLRVSLHPVVQILPRIIMIVRTIAFGVKVVSCSFDIKFVRIPIISYKLSWMIKFHYTISRLCVCNTDSKTASAILALLCNRQSDQGQNVSCGMSTQLI